MRTFAPSAYTLNVPVVVKLSLSVYFWERSLTFLAGESSVLLLYSTYLTQTALANARFAQAGYLWINAGGKDLICRSSYCLKWMHGNTIC